MNLIDLIFPKYCLGCKRTGIYICSDCIKRLQFSKKICIECARASVDGMTHSKCKGRYILDGSLAVWRYESVVKKALYKLKYKFCEEITRDLAKYASDYLKENITALPKNALLVPIPLHPFRKNWRGFNQSGKIGKRIAEKMGWGYEENLLSRKKFTPTQTKLKKKEREKNLIDAFEVNQSCFCKPQNPALRGHPEPQLLSHPEFSSGSKAQTQLTFNTPIIIFDDVTTTGSTLREAGKVLKKEGFKTVWGLALAK